MSIKGEAMRNTRVQRGVFIMGVAIGVHTLYLRLNSSYTDLVVLEGSN